MSVVVVFVVVGGIVKEQMGVLLLVVVVVVIVAGEKVILFGRMGADLYPFRGGDVVAVVEDMVLLIDFVPLYIHTYRM
jgi:hypothetical protein